MDPFVRPKNTTPDQDSVFRQIEERAQGTLINLSGVPTTTNKLLNTNQAGQYGAFIYWNVNGTLRKVSAPSISDTDPGVAVSDLADGTPGELITWGADTKATEVAAGTVGQTLTSKGAGAAPTFQTPSTHWQYVTESDIAAVTNMDFLGLEAGYDYKFTIVNATTDQTNGRSLWMRTASETSGTPTYDDGANDYASDAINNAINLVKNMNNEGSWCEAILYNPMSASTYTYCVAQGGAWAFIGGVGVYHYSSGHLGGLRREAAQVGSVRFRLNSNNFLATGTIYVYRRLIPTS